jgi:hypothetical protein
MARSGSGDDVVVLRPGLATRLLSIVPVGLVIVLAAVRTLTGTRQAGGLVIALSVSALVLLLAARPTVHLTPTCLVVGTARRSTRVAWSDITEVDVVAAPVRHVRVRSASGGTLRLPAPTWLGRRAQADLEFAQLIDWWNRYRGQFRREVPVPIVISVPAPTATRTERRWAAAVCACMYAVPIGLVVAFLAAGRSEFVTAHVKGAVNYAICLAGYLGGAVALAVVGPPGFIFLLALVVMYMMISPWFAAFQAYQGGPPAWPLVFRVLR